MRASCLGSITAVATVTVSWDAFWVSTPHRQLIAFLQTGKSTLMCVEWKKIIVRMKDDKKWSLLRQSARYDKLLKYLNCRLLAWVRWVRLLNRCLLKSMNRHPLWVLSLLVMYHDFPCLPMPIEPGNCDVSKMSDGTTAFKTFPLVHSSNNN